ncbi:hypothetical protein ACROYT_G015132 [Oculina patagonica]
MKFPIHVVTQSDQGAIGGVELEVQSDNAYQELFIGTVTSAPPVEDSAWFTNLRVGGTPIKFKLYTGAEANVLPLSVYLKLRDKSPLSETSVILSSYGGFKRNVAICREHHRIPPAEDIASRLSGKKVFSIVDEKDGFWQVCLDDESSHLCTFNTPYGRYRFKRMPFGISSAPEVFQKKNAYILETLMVWKSYLMT